MIIIVYYVTLIILIPYDCKNVTLTMCCLSSVILTRLLLLHVTLTIQLRDGVYVTLAKWLSLYVALIILLPHDCNNVALTMFCHPSVILKILLLLHVALTIQLHEYVTLTTWLSSYVTLIHYHHMIVIHNTSIIHT